MGLFINYEEAVYARKYIEEKLRGNFVRKSNFPKIEIDLKQQKLIEEQMNNKLKEKNLL